MSEFCTNCSKKMFSENIESDINVEQIFKSLKPGYMTGVLCEGCGLSYIGKTDENQLVVAYLQHDEEGNSIFSDLVPYE